MPSPAILLKKTGDVLGSILFSKFIEKIVNNSLIEKLLASEYNRLLSSPALKVFPGCTQAREDMTPLF